MIEYALVLPFVVVFGVASLLAMFYAVTQNALDSDVTRVVERAVHLDPARSAVAYCSALHTYVSAQLDAERPFYSAYVDNLRTTRISLEPVADSEQNLLTVSREGDFDLLRSRDWGLPFTVTATASVLLPRSSFDGTCESVS